MEDQLLTPEDIQEEISRCDTKCETCHTNRENEDN